MNYSNFIYLAYLYKISDLNETDIKEELKGTYFLAILSFPIIIFTGLIMSLLLSSPNMSAGFVQIFLLLSFLIMINEFPIIYKISRLYNLASKGKYNKIKNQTSLGFLILLIIENIGTIYILILVAIRFELPTTIGSLFLILLTVATMGYIFSKTIKKAKHID